MKQFLLIALLSALTACQTLPQPPPPNTCEVWSRSAEAKLTSSGVWARVLDIQFKEGQGHAVCVFEHTDGNLWCYDPALKISEGNYGGSFCLWTTNRDALYLSKVCSLRPVRAAHFISL